MKAVRKLESQIICESDSIASACLEVLTTGRTQAIRQGLNLLDKHLADLGGTLRRS